MKKIILLLVLVFYGISDPGPAAAGSIQWENYRDGIRLARQENKKIFLHFKTDWCRYCKLMEKTTFEYDKVLDYLASNFICIKVDGDNEPKIAKAYKVTGYPDNLFLDEKGRQAYRRPGLLEPEVFYFFLEYIKSGAYRTMDPMVYYRSR